MANRGEAIAVSGTVTIPGRAVTIRAETAAGPGGQHVNKVATRVVLLVDLRLVRGLSDSARRRLLEAVQRRLARDGRLRVSSQRYRDRARNLEDARDKVRAIVARAIARRRPRVPTRPSTTARQRRLADKRLTSERKRRRRWVPDE